MENENHGLPESLDGSSPQPSARTRQQNWPTQTVDATFATTASKAAFDAIDIIKVRRESLDDVPPPSARTRQQNWSTQNVDATFATAASRAAFDVQPAQRSTSSTIDQLNGRPAQPTGQQVRRRHAFIEGFQLRLRHGRAHRVLLVLARVRRLHQ